MIEAHRVYTRNPMYGRDFGRGAQSSGKRLRDDGVARKVSCL